MTSDPDCFPPLFWWAKMLATPSWPCLYLQLAGHDVCLETGDSSEFYFLLWLWAVLDTEVWAKLQNNYSRNSKIACWGGKWGERGLWNRLNSVTVARGKEARLANWETFAHALWPPRKTLGEIQQSLFQFILLCPEINWHSFSFLPQFRFCKPCS